MLRRRVFSTICAAVLFAASGAASGCKSVPPAVPAPPAPAPVSADRKIGWILRLEQSRALTESAAAPAPPADSSFQLATVPDLRWLARDPDPVLRRRAVLAIGRIGVADGLSTLTAALQDPDAGVRAMAAFALGILGEPAGFAPLRALLGDVALPVRRSAIEALGVLADRCLSDPASCQVVTPGNRAGLQAEMGEIAAAILEAAASCGPVLGAVAPDDEEWPKSPEIELCRTAIFTLTRTRQAEAVAALVLDAQGAPVGRWWPVAYALRRTNDPRAIPALRTLAAGPGAYTLSFALAGLGALQDPELVSIAGPLAARADADIKLRVAAVRALGDLTGREASAALVKALGSSNLPIDLTIEIVTALGDSGDRTAFDTVIDFLADRSPAVRAAALTAGAALDPDSFLFVLSGRGRDPDWSVRAALATVLGTLPAERVTPAIEDLVADEDARVHGAALTALAAVKAPSLTSRLFAALDASDFVERGTAARLIGQVKAEGGAARLAAAYDRAATDDAYGARAGAIEGLAQYGGDDAKAVLRRALSDPSWPIRVRAASLLQTLGESDARPTRPAPLRLPAEAFESDATLRPAFSPHAFLETRLGTVEMELDVVDATFTTQSFVALARAGFFKGLKLHRVVPSFVVQLGDPRGDGEGGPGFTIPDELNPHPFLRGTLGMALEWPDTGGSQWFITLSPQPHLDGKYSVFGRVVNGWDVLDQLSPWDVIDSVRIWDGVEFR